MKHKIPPFSPSFSFINKKNPPVLCVDSLALLPFVLSFFKKTVILNVDKDDFYNVVSFFDFTSPGFAALGSFTKTASPLNIVNFHELLRSLSVSRCDSSLNSLRVILVERGLEKKLLFSSKKKNSFNLNSKHVDFDDLISFLINSGYNKKNELLSQGEFVCRGGVVDVIPFNSVAGLRISFLTERVAFFCFNVDTGEKTNDKNHFIVPKNEKEDLSMLEIMKKNIITYSLENNKRFTLNPSSKKTLPAVLFSSFSYQGYKSLTKNNFSFFYSKNLDQRGCFVDKKTAVVPLWFSIKEKNTSTNSVLRNSMLVGDFYIHEKHGVCQFVGVEKCVDSEKDFFVFVFSDGRVRLDVSLLVCVSFLSHQDEKNITLDSLNKKSGWSRRLSYYNKKAEKHAFVLVGDYSKRELARKTPYRLDKEYISLFARGFPYKETPDQKKALVDIFADLCSPVPMYRLLCGDVGFGKTEVAIRSSFLAVINQRRVLVVCPTTILSCQLFSSFNSRLSSFGVFVSLFDKNNPDAYVFDFKNKNVDVLVGTHSILNNSALLSLCDFLIIDDEHRFGVAQKEGFMKKNPSCDALFMSATPLPRSLQLSLSKIRNISLVQTPPKTRKPIITNVCFFNKSLLFRCVSFECLRGGQVYVVGNSVNNVKTLARLLVSRFSSFRIKTLYSGLGDTTIQKTMSQFRNGNVDVLVSTSIIESGIDVGRVSTILIINSHLFGLSQLHQLRGRVGRSSVQSFAYLFVPYKKPLSFAAQQRLSSLKKHSSLGSGYLLSLEDLKIRGAGFLFGNKQSGIVSVGFDFYYKLVAKYLSLFGGVAFSLVVVDLKRGFIPSFLVPDTHRRASLYKSLSNCLNLKDFKVVELNFKDFFGKIPNSVYNLLQTTKTSLMLAGSCVVSVVASGGTVSISLNEPLSFFSKSFALGLSVFFKKQGLCYVFKNHKNTSKIQYKQTEKDDYIVIQLLSGFLYEK